MINRRTAALILLLGTFGCSKTATIYNVHNAPLDVRASATTSDLAPAIRDAAEQLSWSVQEVRPGEMRAMRTRGQHTAVVAILYGGQTFSIQYVESSNLKADGTKVHKTYNRWIQELEEAIQRNARFRLQ